MTDKKIDAKKLEALEKVADYILDCENQEYDSYVEYCEDNELEPSDIHGEQQSQHVYALALIGTGSEFPTD